MIVDNLTKCLSSRKITSDDSGNESVSEGQGHSNV